MKNAVEFYLDAAYQPFCTVQAEFQPSEGDLVNINRVTYQVIGRSFTVDDANLTGINPSMRCNVIVRKFPK